MQAFFTQHLIFGDRDSQRAYGRQFSADPAARSDAIHLNKHQHLHLNGACGWAVHAMAGTVWVTQDGNARDIVLEAGESFVLDRDRDTLLSSLNGDEAQVSLERGTCRQTALRHARKAHPSPALPAAPN